MPRLQGLSAETERHFVAGSLLYLGAWAVHSGDHIRRGLFEPAVAVQVLGNVQVVLTLGFIVLLLIGHRLGPTLAVAIGVPATLGIAMAHLLPDFGPLSDSLWVDGIDAFSWFAVLLEIAGSTLLSVVGWRAWREQQPTAVTS